MTTVKYNSREELLAAVKRAIARKKEWEENARRSYLEDRKALGLPVNQ